MAANDQDPVPTVPVPPEPVPTGIGTPVEMSTPVPITDPYFPPAAEPATATPVEMTAPVPHTDPYSPGTPASSAAPAPPQRILSILSMTAGILGLLVTFFGWGFVFAIAAVILGHIAVKRERDAKPFWLTGLITGYVGLAFAIGQLLILLVFVLGFAFLLGSG